MPRPIEEILADQPHGAFEPQVTDENVASFNEHGFTSIDRITTDVEVVWLREVYDWIYEPNRTAKAARFDLARPYDSAGEDLLPQILAPERVLPALMTTLFWKNGRKVASRFLGADASQLNGWGHMIRKPPKTGAPLPWHQDEAYWDPAMIYKAMGSWLPLDDATIENGCMSFVPGSHRGEVREHWHVNNDPSVHALYCKAEEAEIARAIPVPVPAGGCVFHQSRTLHASGPNTTDKVRRAWANEWQLAPVKADAPAQRRWIDEHHEAWSKRNLDDTRKTWTEKEPG
jgi:hypothetical protein